MVMMLAIKPITEQRKMKSSMSIVLLSQIQVFTHLWKTHIVMDHPKVCKHERKESCSEASDIDIISHIGYSLQVDMQKNSKKWIIKISEISSMIFIIHF